MVHERRRESIRTVDGMISYMNQVVSEGRTEKKDRKEGRREVQENMKNIAVLMTALDSNAQEETLRGIEDYGKTHGYNIAVFLWFTGVTEKEKQNLGEINIAYLPDLNLFDGIILFANVFHKENNRKRIEELLENVHCPVVTIGCQMKGYTSVCTDNYTAMRELMEHFVKEHQMTKIHFVKGVEGNPDGEERYRAYVDVLKENGIPMVPERVTHGDFYVTGGELAVREILDRKEDLPQAVVCANDIMALTVCDMLIYQGYRVPEDIAVSGYDYSAEGQEHIPAMTTVRSRFHDLGSRACELVIEEAGADFDESMAGRKILLPDEVLVSESCGCDSGVPYGDLRGRAYSTSEVGQRQLILQMTILEKHIMEGEGIVDWLKAVQDFVLHLDPPELYWCVNEDFVETVFELDVMEQEEMSIEEKLAYTEEVRVLLAYYHGKFQQKGTFESRLALDALFEDADEPKTYIFSSLHYLERNFGYLVFVDSNFPMGNPLYVSWLIKMGDSIENIRKQSLLRNAMARLDEMYIRDPLTGVLNRFGMERFFSDIKRKCMMSRSKMQLSFIDVDGLKQINDEYGHEEGDRIINAAATVLQQPTGKFKVVRYGGDEFIVMGNVRSEKEVVAYWNRVEEAVNTYNEGTKKKAKLSLSYGYEIFKIDSQTCLENCISVSDKIMYDAKRKKKQHCENEK